MKHQISQNSNGALSGLPPEAQTESAPTLPSRPEIAASVLVKVQGTTPYIVVSFPREAHQLLTVEPIPGDVIRAYSRLATIAPGLLEETTRSEMYAQSRVIECPGDLNCLSAIVYRFFSYFDSNPTMQLTRLKANIGTPLGLQICGPDGRVWAEIKPSPPPLYTRIRSEANATMEKLARDYLATGRQQELAALEERTALAFEVFGAALRLRQLGFGNIEAAQILNARFPSLPRKISSNQILNWSHNHKIPGAITYLISGNRERHHNTRDISLPLRTSLPFSYLLGVQVGRAKFESTTSEVGLLHPSRIVINRLKAAIRGVGIDPPRAVVKRSDAGEKKLELRVRSTSLNGGIYELTYGYTRLPWPYLIDPAEKKAFLCGITDSLAVAWRERITFTKAGGKGMLEELAILLADFGIYGEVVDFEKTKLRISTPRDVAAFQKLVGKRYPELDQQVEAAARLSRGKYHASVAEYRLFEAARDSLINPTARSISESLIANAGIRISEPVISKWQRGIKPRCMELFRAVEKYRLARPYIDEVKELSRAGIPRSLIIQVFERQVA